MRLTSLGLALAIGLFGLAPARSQLAAAPQPLFLFIYKAGPAWKPGVPATGQPLREHGAYMTKLAKEGVLIAGGPFADADGGLAVLRAPDAAAARAVLAADPAVTGGVMTAEVRGWTPFLGTGEPVPVKSPTPPKPAGG